ncbi:hypothetical protein [Allorhodopirellula heiligendammensis]|uniref:Uncharacterized protein n=1 Tax=Allorhodopirellula heiligendammensis TaxID=2714739 RepID=A0A5C6C4S3_9BACT|nr:hypothetical protein [Allorhodopirellula heiligendammensis]TWU19553.1 hypothetical protein Poly21_17270 [Allorhodopirellula heiligendammensis]
MKIEPSVAPRLWFHVLDVSSIPVADLAPSDIESAAYVTVTAGIRSAEATIAIGAKVADTAAKVTGQLVTIRATDGWYAIDAPPGAALSTADTAEIAIVLVDGSRLVYPTQHPIDSGLEIDTATIATDVAAELSGTTVVVNSPTFNGENGEDLDVEQGDDYADTPARIDIESAADLTGLHFVLAARLTGSGAGGMTLRMPIQSDEVGQFAEFAPTSEQTETWTPGTYDLRHRIELGANKYRTLKRGRLTVRPFDTPPTVYEVGTS